MSKAQFGMIGLGTMGRNFLLNVAEHGFSCLGYDLDAGKRALLVEEGGQARPEWTKKGTNSLESRMRVAMKCAGTIRA